MAEINHVNSTRSQLQCLQANYYYHGHGEIYNSNAEPVSEPIFMSKRIDYIDRSKGLAWY